MVPPQGDTNATGIRLDSRPQPAEQALYNIPLTSAMVKESAATTRLTCAQRDQWARDNLPSRIQVALATPFGKDSLVFAYFFCCYRISTCFPVYF
jgi:hypothetical protein